jgi:hypothetical protein
MVLYPFFQRVERALAHPTNGLPCFLTGPRQGHDETTAVPGLAFYTDLPVVAADDLGADRQP